MSQIATLIATTRALAWPLADATTAHAIDLSLWASRAAEFFRFEYEFIARALIAAALVGACAGLVGVFLVLRRMSLLGDATGHATLPGVAIAFLITGEKSLPILLLGALATAMAATLLIGWLGRQPKTRADANIGVILAGFFGLGVVLLSIVQRSTTGAQTGINSFLFGNAAGISESQLWLLGASATAAMLFVVVMFRPLALRAFDPGFANASGIAVSALDTGFIITLSVAVVVALECVGVVLVSAMLIIPASTALFISKDLKVVCAASAAIGAFSGLLGVFLSTLQEGFSSGPMMVLSAALCFALALLFGPRGGALRRAPATSTEKGSRTHAL